jgi:hypothetical protein
VDPCDLPEEARELLEEVDDLPEEVREPLEEVDDRE